MSVFKRVEIVNTLTEEIAFNFTAFLNAWHSLPETYDDALDAQIHRWYSDFLSDGSRKVWPPKGIPYFSPSSANADARGLYEKLRGAKKDGGGQPPHQGRWTRIGTAIGDVIQRDILFAEKHTENPRFVFERNEFGEPMFEDFAKKGAVIDYVAEDGKKKSLALYGTGDGILRYITEDGEVIRVGLEVKSKQTTSAQTSDYMQRYGPKDDHVKQCVCYSIMYDVDYYIILYVNGSKKAWGMGAEDFEKSPDIKAHCIEITDDMRNEVLTRFAGIVEAADSGAPPPLDLGKWLFNGFKRAISKSMSDEEYATLKRQVYAIQVSGLKDFEKRNYADAFDELTQLREAAV